ncbi:AI-2E family transporter [Croceitalea rosinachiae]|uniref:AI-2E family transporter n=1 Tax=Croceitalea rosinachiae TaxID=3075596 RepID=A0ABU3AC14_9FLAO|nr:AI-2E family transporter [Croceitalea sp. F388]MDT0607720.1 AI-2E family transporter [Croceitalea sp. F388]
MKKLAFLVIGIGGIIALLIMAKNIIIPFAYGVALWFLGRYFKNLAYKIPLFKKYLPSWLISSIIFVFIIITISLIAGIISSSVDTLIEAYPSYQSNIDTIVNKLNDIFHIDVYQNLTEKLKDFDFSSLLQTIADSISGIFGDIVMVLLYAMFIISEETSFLNKLKKIFNRTEDFERVIDILNKIYKSISDYIGLKTLVSLLTGLVGYIFLALMDVDAPFFWALLMFLLNYIPTIGSLIATIFPAFFSLIQFGEFTPFIIILIGLGLVQWFIGNVLEPKIMGSSLNISPLVTIIALVVWGQIWGITGMLLSVPITVVMIIVFSQFKSTRAVAILLSENGEIE